MASFNVTVIGAGPSGLAAALSALKRGASVLVLERMEVPGKKLLLTGNGQCNLSNSEVGPKHYHGNSAVIETVLKGFSFTDMIGFMKELSVETETIHYRHEECGYLYPKDHSSVTVRDHMTQKICSLGGKILTGCQISKVSPLSNGYSIDTSIGCFESGNIIFATGSNAYPKTGSDSSIFPVLRSLGIIQKTWLPALVALKSDSPVLKDLKGLRVDADVSLENLDTGEKFDTKPGEVQFREHYISGLPVLQLSRYASIGLHKKQNIVLRMQLYKANNKDGKLPFEYAEFNITGTEGFDHAICCSGGIKEKDIDPFTLESTFYKGIFFAGEMIDVDGDCGGFNLHFAIASGLLAGRNAAG